MFDAIPSFDCSHCTSECWKIWWLSSDGPLNVGVAPGANEKVAGAARQAAMCVLIMRRRREGLMGPMEKAVVKMIARYVWATRGDAAWLGHPPLVM